MTNGIYGANLTDFGLSRENVHADLRRIGGALAVVRNSPELAALAVAEGTPFVVYRETDDDPQHDPLGRSPRDFVLKRASKVHPAAYIHLTNELDPSLTLNEWTKIALDVCDEIGRKAVIFNFSTHKSKAQYDMSAAVIERAVRGGHAMGVHVYETPILDIDFDAYRWVDLKERLGGVWLVTEFGYIENIHVAEVGYRAALSDDDHVRFLRYHGGFLAQLNTPAALFSYDHWTDNEAGRVHGFGFLDRPYVISTLEGLNVSYPYKSENPPERVLTEGVITSTKANVVNVRRTASTSSQIVRTLRVGDRINYDPNAIEAGAYRVGTTTLNTWYALHDGFIAAGVVTIAGADDEPDQPVRKLDVPFVSQLGPDADRRNNDCGVACSIMLIQYRLKQAGLRSMKALTVDRLIEDTPLALSDKPQGLSILTGLLDAYGVDAQIARPLNPDAIMREIDADKPVIALVNYQQIGGESFGHYVTIIGYGERGFYLHDPYKRGAEMYVTREVMDAALTDVSGFASFPYQGVTLS